MDKIFVIIFGVSFNFNDVAIQFIRKDNHINNNWTLLLQPKKNREKKLWNRVK